MTIANLIRVPCSRLSDACRGFGPSVTESPGIAKLEATTLALWSAKLENLMKFALGHPGKIARMGIRV